MARRVLLSATVVFTSFANAALIAALVASFTGHGAATTFWQVLGIVCGLMLLGLLIELMRSASVVGKLRVAPPALEGLVRAHAESLAIAVPGVGVLLDDAINCFTLGVGRRAVVVVTSGLLEECDDDEDLNALMAHEVSHVARGDALVAVLAEGLLSWMYVTAMIGTLVSGFIRIIGRGFSEQTEGEADALTGGMVRLGFQLVFFVLAASVDVYVYAWFAIALIMERALVSGREIIADADAVQLIGSPQSLAGALAWFADHSTDLGRQGLQSRAVAGVPRTGHWSVDAFNTHPPMPRRIRLILEERPDRVRKGLAPALAGTLASGSIFVLMIVGALTTPFNAYPAFSGTSGVAQAPVTGSVGPTTEGPGGDSAASSGGQQSGISAQVTTTSEQSQTGTVTTSASSGQDPTGTGTTSTGQGPTGTATTTTSSVRNPTGTDTSTTGTGPPGTGPTDGSAGGQPPPQITSTGTYQQSPLVYISVTYQDADGDAVGFGFRGANGSSWAEENHLFSSPSYGTASPGRVDYPFNDGCGTSQQTQTDIEFWIYDAEGLRSSSVVQHLACSSAPPSPPHTPTVVAVHAVDQYTMTVSWTDASGTATGFNVDNGCPAGYTGCPAGATLAQMTTGPSATFTTTPGAYQCFRVQAFNSVGASPWSGYACTTTPPLMLQAAQPWVDTGVDLTAGTNLTVRGSGTVIVDTVPHSWGPSGDGSCIPAQRYPPPFVQFLATNLHCWALIARIGNGAPFEVGASATVTATSGRLYLTVNDAAFNDNSGAWTVGIKLGVP